MHSDDLQYLSYSLADCFNLAGRELVSLVGAGGKTALMTVLAEELSLSGQRVLTTTTTRVYKPRGQVVVEADRERLVAGLAGRITPGENLAVAAGLEEAEFGRLKMVGLAPETVDRVWESGAAEFVLVEADGAKGRPVKAPRDHEPVIPQATTILIGLIGLGAVGRAVTEETVFAVDRFVAVTGAEPGREITPAHLARLIAHPEGLFKGTPPEAWPVVFLNQFDLPGARQAGLEVLRILGPLKSGLRVVLGSVLTGVREVYDLAD